MLKDKVINALRIQFGDAVSIDAESRDFAIFPAKHHSVGNVTVEENYGELIVSIGTITHGHFGCYEEGLSEDEEAEAIARSLVGFLVDLFEDKYFLRKGKWSGGWTHVDLIKDSDMKSPKVKWLKWSGPIRGTTPTETDA